MRVIVTGATGYIGSRIAVRLQGAGAEVVASGRREAPELEALGLRFRRADLTDARAAASLLQGADVVLHCAAWMGSRGEPGAGQSVNVDATAGVARACAAGGVGRLVHVSSIAACGPPGGRPRVGGGAPADPEQAYPYGRTKAQGELAVRAVASATGLPLVIVRPGLVHGPGSEPWTRDLQARVRRGARTRVGDGRGLAPLVYIENLLDVLEACVSHPDAPSRVFHVVDEPVTWRQLFDAHARYARRPARSLPAWVARAVARIGETTGWVVPITRYRLDFVLAQTDYRDGEVEQRLGITQRVAFPEAMEASWRWLEATS